MFTPIAVSSIYGGNVLGRFFGMSGGSGTMDGGVRCDGVCRCLLTIGANILVCQMAFLV